MIHSTHSKAILVCGSILLALACGCGEPAPPPKPIVVTLMWQSDADLDVVINGAAGYLLGGSPDATTGGGTEAITLDPDRIPDSSTVGVVNRSAEPGGSGAAGIPCLLTITDRHEKTVTIELFMERTPIDAFVVFPSLGKFSLLEQPAKPAPDTAVTAPASPAPH